MNITRPEVLLVSSFWLFTSYGGVVAAQPQAGAADPLSRPVHSIDGRAISLGSLVAALANDSGARIIVDWKTLESAGIDQQAPVEAHFHGCTVGAALHAVFSRPGLGRQQLWAMGQAIFVDNAADMPFTTRVYPIADLSRANPAMAPADAADQLVQIVESSVSPDDWKDNGGSTAEIRASADSLVVLQTAEGHAAVQAALDGLRSAMALRPSHPDFGPFSEYAVLHWPVGDVSLKGITLAEVIDVLERRTHANMLIDWKVLRDCGVALDEPVTINLRNATLGEALDALTSSHAACGLACCLVRDGVVWITAVTARDENPMPRVRVYNLKALIDTLVDYDAAHSRAMPNAPMLPRVASPQGRSRREARDAIGNLLETAAHPDSWKDNGGSGGSMQTFGDELVITQSDAGHRQVDAVLDAFAAATRPTAVPANLPPAKPSLLDATIDELHLNSASLDEAVNALVEKTHARIVVNWAALHAAGLTEVNPITVQVGDVPLHTALAITLELAGRNIKLAYRAGDDGVIRISTPTDLDHDGVTRIYNIRDLIDDFLTYERTHRPGIAAPQANNSPTAQDAVDMITKLIEDTVDTDTWKDNGGATGSLRELCGLLIVTTTPQSHEKVEGFLAKLRLRIGDFGDRGIQP